MTNGTEAVFCIIALYYYTKLNYEDDNKNKSFKPDKKNLYLIFDKNMALMTFAITIAFIVRSSSIIGWIPLALLYIFNASSI
jgi:hypothetical protein